MALDKDLQFILGEADKITIGELEFDKLFREQSKILCDVKTLLQKDKDITNSSKCDLSTIKNDSKFKQILNNLKNKYSTIKQNNKINHSKKTSKTSKSSKSRISRISSKSKTKHSSSKNKIKMGKINNDYPIILLKDKKPYKNVIMVKNQ